MKAIPPRVIPVLLYRAGGLYKTTGFRNPVYVGDPINAVRIFNEKEVDELVFLDIDANVQNRRPDLQALTDIAGECFMPVCYGGGVRSTDDIRALLGCGIEKVALCSAALEDPGLVRRAAGEFGSSTIVVAIDARKDWTGRYHAYSHGGRKKTRWRPLEFAREVERAGAGEILLTSIDRDGTQTGYDLALIASVAGAVGIPVIAAGGAGSVADFERALQADAAAVAAGSMFVFHGRHRAVLINFPGQDELCRLAKHR